MAGVVNIPCYPTVFRADKFAFGLGDMAPVARRSGASDYEVMRSNDDRYRFWQFAHFESKADFERYYYGPEFINWRADYTSYFQVPVVYSWFDRVVAGEIAPNNAHVV